jgi:hypothetical protein
MELIYYKLSTSTDPAWEFMYTPKLAFTVGHFVSRCACFLFFWSKIGRYLMSLGCLYHRSTHYAHPLKLVMIMSPCNMHNGLTFSDSYVLLTRA